ncbi:MAG: group II intron reverse transcriptase/maturase, partial [Firmicutes bacterium]|nr:group II intron reverse transcriptase/maturase [Bacillota bacterium]
HGKNVESQIQALNRVLRGWINYFRIANCKSWLQAMMQWIRRRLRMKQLREWKSWKALHKALRRNGHWGDFDKISMRRWRNSASPLVSMALPNRWLDQLGLIDLCQYEVGILHRYQA